MRYFDAHTHVNFAAFQDDMHAAIARAADAGVGMNVVGTQFETSKAAVELAEKYSDVFATVGLHPIHTAKSYHDEKELGEGGRAFTQHLLTPDGVSAGTSNQNRSSVPTKESGAWKGAGFTSRGEQFDAVAYEKLAKSPKVIAIGECGLDYFRLEENTKKTQEQAFVQQIQLANKLNKPLMLHIRNAYEDAIAILKREAKVKGDVHFFAGDWNIAKQFLDFGITLSFTGVITFTHDYDEVIKNAPLDMLLSETDAPYVAPVPYRGKRNEPAYVVEVVKAIARIRDDDEEVVRNQIFSNVKRLFGI